MRGPRGTGDCQPSRVLIRHWRWGRSGGVACGDAVPTGHAARVTGQEGSGASSWVGAIGVESSHLQSVMTGKWVLVMEPLMWKWWWCPDHDCGAVGCKKLLDK